MISKRRILSLFLMGVLISLWIPAAHADNPFDKLSRGLTNILTTAVGGEFAVHATKQHQDHLPVAGFFRSIFYGTYYTTVRLIAGVYETGTFLIPIPWRYKTVIHPETLA